MLLDWLGTFGKIIVKPTAQTYEQEAKKAEGKFASAYILLALLLPIFSLIMTLGNYMPTGYWDDLQVYVIIIFSLVFPVVIFFFVFCLVTIYKKIYKRKREIYNEVLYLMVSIFVVLSVISFLTALVPAPYGNYLFWLVLGYTLFLMIGAFKAISKLKLGQSIFTVLLSIFIATIGLLCIPFFLLSVVQVTPEVLG